MATKAIYFTHMSNALTDEKIIKLRRKYGMQGYGIYFAILEKLSTTNGYKLPVDSISDIAYDINTDENIVTDVVKNYNLFEYDEGYFYSNAHRLFMCYKDEKSEAKRKGAMARLEKLSAEELKIQNTKAARKRWDDEKLKKDDASKMQAVYASDASKMHSMQAVQASDAIDKDKDTDTDKNKDIDTDKEKEKDVDKEQNFSSGFSSIYFGSVLNQKMVEVYNTNSKVKSELTYNQFENMFLYYLVDRLSIEGKKEFHEFSREYIIGILNTKLKGIVEFILPMLDSEIIQIFKNDESGIRYKLERFKL